MSGKLLVAEIKQCFRIKVWASINTSLSKFLNVFNSTAKIDARRVRLYLFNLPFFIVTNTLKYTAHNTLCLYFPGMSVVFFTVKTWKSE